MIDHRVSQERKVWTEHRQLLEQTSHEQFLNNCRSKKYPAGATYLWALGAVYGPIGSADRNEAAE